MTAVQVSDSNTQSAVNFCVNDEFLYSLLRFFSLIYLYEL